MNLPAGHQQVIPYIMVPDGPVLIQFLQDTFDAQLGPLIKNANGKKIIHGEIKIGECTLFFADGTGEEVEYHDDCESDDQASPKDYKEKEPSNIHIYVYVDDANAVMEKAVKAGGRSVMPLMDDESGQMGGVLDPFNNLWWIKSSK